MTIQRASLALFCSMALTGALVACGEDDEDEGGGKKGTTPTELAITADWINGTVSYVDLAKVKAGRTSKADVVTREIDLRSRTPGPLALELSHDKKRLFVSMSAGFFAIPGAGLIINESDIPTGPGSLMVFDVESGEQLADIDTGEGPMGVVTSKDDKRAIVAHFTSGDLAVVDLDTYTVIERAPLGQFPEEVALDDTGAVGIVGWSARGSVSTFAVDDVAGSVSPEVVLQGDSAGVAFFPGTKTALVVQAPNPLSPSSGYTLVDVSDPRAPVVLADERSTALNVAYPAIAAPKRNSIIVPITKNGKLYVEEYKLEGDKVSIAQTNEVTDATLLSALGVAYDGDHTVLMALASQRALAVADLETGESHLIPWEVSRAGPADVVVR